MAFLDLTGNAYASEADAILANRINMGYGGNTGAVAPTPIQTRKQIADTNLATLEANGAAKDAANGIVNGRLVNPTYNPAPQAPQASTAFQQAQADSDAWRTFLSTPNPTAVSYGRNGNVISGNPTTFPGSLAPLPKSPLIPQAAHDAVAALQSIMQLQIVITDSAGVQHRGTIRMEGSTAVLSVQL